MQSRTVGNSILEGAVTASSYMRDVSDSGSLASQVGLVVEGGCDFQLNDESS